MDNNYTGTIIKKDKLIFRKWIPPMFDKDDNVTEEGHYREDDVSDSLIYYLNDTCIIEEGTTLRDLFKMLDNHREILNKIYLTLWFEDYLNLGLNSPESKPNNVSYLEVYTNVEYDKQNLKINGKRVVQESTSLQYNFHGVYEKEDGEKENIAFFGSQIPYIIDLPLKLNNILTFYDNDDHFSEYGNFDDITLNNIIYAIFWELSFNGDPDNTSKKEHEIFEIAEKYQN